MIKDHKLETRVHEGRTGSIHSYHQHQHSKAIAESLTGQQILHTKEIKPVGAYTVNASSSQNSMSFAQEGPLNMITKVIR
jgi:hypothetical protein